MRYLNKEELNNLPKEVIIEVKEILKAYGTANIVFQNGKYEVSASTGIYKFYPEDHKFIGVVKSDDIYTKEEKMVNYIEEFHSYPIEYKGKRNYKMLAEIGNDYSKKFKLENGNLVLA